MAVYVDAIRHYPATELAHKHWCHMVADSEEELHAMARLIGMRPSSFQSPTPDKPWRIPHYDLPPNRRSLAVEYGAIVIDWRGMALRIRAYRETQRNSR